MYSSSYLSYHCVQSWLFHAFFAVNLHLAIGVLQETTELAQVSFGGRLLRTIGWVYECSADQFIASCWGNFTVDGQLQSWKDAKSRKKEVRGQTCQNSLAIVWAAFNRRIVSLLILLDQGYHSVGFLAMRRLPHISDFPNVLT